MSDQGGDDGDMGIELDLAGEVEDDHVFFRKRFQGAGKEIEVFEEKSRGMC